MSIGEPFLAPWWRVWRLSVPWALVGVLLFVFEIADKFLNKPSAVGLLTITLFLGFLGVVRGTFALRRFNNSPSTAIQLG